MERVAEILSVMERIRVDPRIGPLHLSLYLAILYRWSLQDFHDPVQVSARTLMPLAKIAGLNPYHRCIRQLHEYGYIRYEPSYNPAAASLVYLPGGAFNILR